MLLGSTVLPVLQFSFVCVINKLVAQSNLTHNWS